MMKIVSRMRKKMQEEGLSAYALEKRAGLKPSVVHNILQGRSKNPAISTLHSVAKALNCTVSDLIGEEAPSLSLPQQDSVSSPIFIHNNELYINCLAYLCSFLKKRKIFLDRDQVLNYVNEIYAFSLKKGSNRVDAHFVEWIVEKNMKQDF
jgi:transcriptional regulator with XRE-family HTH domain